MTDSDEDDFIDNSTSTRARIRDVTLSIPTGHVLGDLVSRLELDVPFHVSS